ncbi:MAG: hypothetical protein L0Z49_14295 [Actinobacteria bacterium]|nr:hypothetical protein [Actinomycetota bacterium]MCI0677897.1 hypothetical protein [Actinomycetota bacterium]
MSTEWRRPLPRTWWLRRPVYFQFMIRELTSLVVLAYTGLIIWGLWSLPSLIEFLDSRLSVWLHLLVLVFALFHTGTWIALTPKVVVLWRGDDQIEPDVIAGLASIGFVAVTGVVLWLVLG